MLKTLPRARTLGIIRAPSGRAAVEAAWAAVGEGLRLVELTFTTPEVAPALGGPVQRLPESAVLGAGSVMNGRRAKIALKSGARFLVSPQRGGSWSSFSRRVRGVAAYLFPKPALEAGDWSAVEAVTRAALKGAGLR